MPAIDTGPGRGCGSWKGPFRAGLDRDTHLIPLADALTRQSLIANLERVPAYYLVFLGSYATKLSEVVIISCNSSIHPLSLTLSPRCSELVPQPLSEHACGPIGLHIHPGIGPCIHINGDR